jgi:hypothetical protein
MGVATIQKCGGDARALVNGMPDFTRERKVHADQVRANEGHLL